MQKHNILKIKVIYDEVIPYLNCNKNGEYSFNCIDYKDVINTVQPCITIQVIDTYNVVLRVHKVELYYMYKEPNSTNHRIYTRCLDTGIDTGVAQLDKDKGYQTNYFSRMFNHQDTEEAFNFAMALTVKGKNQRISKDKLFKYELLDSQIRLLGDWVTDETKSMIYCIGGGIPQAWLNDTIHNYIGRTGQANKTSRLTNGHKYHISDVTDVIRTGNLLYEEIAKYGNIVDIDSLDVTIEEYFETLFINLMAYTTGSLNINDAKQYQRGKTPKQQRKLILDNLVEIVLCGVDFRLCRNNLKELCGLDFQLNITKKFKRFCEELSVVDNKNMHYLVDLVCRNTDVTIEEVIRTIRVKKEVKQEVKTSRCSWSSDYVQPKTIHQYGTNNGKLRNNTTWTPPVQEPIDTSMPSNLIDWSEPEDHESLGRLHSWMW